MNDIPVNGKIRIVSDCVILTCQVTRMPKWATTIEFSNISVIIFIQYYLLFLFYF